MTFQHESSQVNEAHEDATIAIHIDTLYIHVIQCMGKYEYSIIMIKYNDTYCNSRDWDEKSCYQILYVYVPQYTP